MLKALLFLLLFTLTSNADIITLESPLRSHDILKGSLVFIDAENSSVQQILKKKSLFRVFEKEKIELGFTRETVWVLFTLKNQSSSTIRPMLEIDNPRPDFIHLYSVEESEIVDHRVQGLMEPLDFHGMLNFSFPLSMEPYSTKQYLLSVSSTINALYFHARVMEQHDLFIKELFHQLTLALFFGLMIGLVIYNFFIYFFTKDIIYFYYVGYQLFLIFGYSSYSTITRHVLPQWAISIDASLGVLYLTGGLLFMLLFTKVFLRLERFRWIDIGIEVLFLFGIMILLLSMSCCYLIDASVYLGMLTSIYLIGVSVYLMQKRVQHAKYFVLGWGVSLLSTITLMFSQLGLAPYTELLPYLYEAGIAFEALLFSVILAQRLNHVKALAVSLDTQKTLKGELHHRVKDNMDLIVKLYRLKFAGVKNEAIKTCLKDSENNIVAMRKVHESLSMTNDLGELDTQYYFQQLVDTFRTSLGGKSITFEIDCTVALSTDQATNCGIIFNELVTNSIKYAFEKGDSGKITIILYKQEGDIHLEVTDNGKGYDLEHTTQGFGLMMVHALVVGELHGSVVVESDKGTRYHIIWKKR